MKYLILLPILCLLLLISCEKNEIATIDNLRAEATVWKLVSSTGHTGGGAHTNDLESERTL